MLVFCNGRCGEVLYFNIIIINVAHEHTCWSWSMEKKAKLRFAIYNNRDSRPRSILLCL